MEGKMFIRSQINQPSFGLASDCLWVPAIFLHFVETGAQFSSDQG